MSDRTYAEITIHLDDYKKHQDKLDDMPYETEESSDLIKGKKVPIMVFRDYEADGGSLDFLEAYLWKHNIEYNKSWENGAEYEAGYEYHRKTKEGYKICNLTKSGDYALSLLKEIFNLEDPKKIKKALQEKILQLEPFERSILKPNIPKSIDYARKINGSQD